MGKTIISKKVIKLNDMVYFPIEKWRLDNINFDTEIYEEGMVDAVGKIVRLQTNGMFNYDIEYNDGRSVITKKRSEITPMGRYASKLWRLLYE